MFPKYAATKGNEKKAEYSYMEETLTKRLHLIAPLQLYLHLELTGSHVLIQCENSYQEV